MLPPARTPGTTVRRSRPSDLAALHELLARCSPDTAYRRFHGVAGAGVRRELERIASSTPAHRSWVAVDRTGAVRGTATLAWGRDGEAEVAFLVEDGHRRRGLGRALVLATALEARRRGVPAVLARLQGDNAAAAAFLLAVAPGVRLAFADGDRLATIPVAPARAAGVAA